jgi:AraC family transcriptional regulator
LARTTGTPIMFCKDFPNLAHLRRLIQERFSNGDGWPNVIINAKATQEYRPDIPGTLSVFSNISGSSWCSTEGNKARIEEDMFYISNNNQEYSLEVDNIEPVETFNIHFSTRMLGDFINGQQPHSIALEDQIGNFGTSTCFYNKLYTKDATFNQLTRALYIKGNAGQLREMMKEELLAALLAHLLQQNQLVHREAEQLGSIKVNTRKEIYRRLSIAADYIISHYQRELTLDEIAGHACLSKFHFLRLFKEVYGQTPYQYLSAVRLKRAAALLQKTGLNAADIAWMVGYEDPTSFSRAFFKTYGYRPGAYRVLAN